MGNKPKEEFAKWTTYPKVETFIQTRCLNELNFDINQSSITWFCEVVTRLYNAVILKFQDMMISVNQQFRIHKTFYNWTAVHLSCLHFPLKVQPKRQHVLSTFTTSFFSNFNWGKIALHIISKESPHCSKQEFSSWKSSITSFRITSFRNFHLESPR